MGCVLGTGPRKLLKLAGAIGNNGPGTSSPLVLLGNMDLLSNQIIQYRINSESDNKENLDPCTGRQAIRWSSPTQCHTRRRKREPLKEVHFSERRRRAMH
jgi:hypothetical protein